MSEGLQVIGAGMHRTGSRSVKLLGSAIGPRAAPSAADFQHSGVCLRLERRL
jgi:hypothetical protein